jgi:hypothetical protein
MVQMGLPLCSLTSSEGRSHHCHSPASHVEPLFAGPCMGAQLMAQPLTEHIRRLTLAPPADTTLIPLLLTRAA